MQLADLFGVGDGPVRWERPMLVLLALTSRNFTWLTVNTLTGADAFGIQPQELVELLVSDAAFVGVVTLVLRSVRTTWVAVIACAVASSVTELALSWIQVVLNGWTDVSISVGLLLGSTALWTLCILGGIAIALARIRSSLAAILIGSTGGAVLNRAVQTVFYLVSEDGLIPGGNLLWRFIVSILAILVFAVVLWGSIRIFSDDDPGRRISRGYFLGSMMAAWSIACFILILVTVKIAAGDWRMQSSDEARPVVVVLAVAGLFTAYAGLLFSILVYRMWMAIADGHARTTPGRAVALLFVPFFNFYWAFVALAGYPKEYNAFARRHEIQAAELPTWPFRAYVVACFAALIPVVGMLAAIVAVVLGLVMVAKSCDAINALPTSSAAEATAPASSIGPVGWHVSAGLWIVAFLIAAASCAAAPGVGTVEAEAQRKPMAESKAELELPTEFGVYHESTSGLRSLMANAVVPAKSPSFIVYLKEMPPAEKLILRFGNSGNMSLYSVKSGELAGVFDARMSPIDGRPEVYRAQLRTDLKPGKYVAYTFTDVSKGAEPWSEARFEYAGSIEVAP